MGGASSAPAHQLTSSGFVCTKKSKQEGNNLVLTGVLTNWLIFFSFKCNSTFFQFFNFNATRTSTSTSPLKSVPSHAFVPGTQEENLILAAEFSRQWQSGGRFWPAAKRRRFLFCGSSSSGILSSSSAATGTRPVLPHCVVFFFLPPPAVFLKVSLAADVCYS